MGMGMSCNICRKDTIDTNGEITFNNQDPLFKEEDPYKQFIKKFEENLPNFGDYISSHEFKKEIPNEIEQYTQNNPLKQLKIPISKQIYNTPQPIQFKNGNLYKGNWNNKLEMEGFGNYILKKEKIFIEGIWNKGILKYGRIYYPNGDIYEGEIRNNLFNGKGKFIYKDNTIFEGDFIHGEKGNYGKIIYNDKSYYEGQLKNGIPNGKGEFKWINGIYYKGYFNYGKIEGEGEIKSQNGSYYIGNFKNNIFHGKGKFFFNTGSIYDGYYYNGKKNGEGLYNKNNGIKYFGNFYDGKIHGCGKIEDNNIIYKKKKKNGFTVETPLIEYKNYNNNNIGNIDLNLKVENEDIDMNKLNYLERDNDIDFDNPEYDIEFKPKNDISKIF